MRCRGWGTNAGLPHLAKGDFLLPHPYDSADRARREAARDGRNESGVLRVVGLECLYPELVRFRRSFKRVIHSIWALE